MPRKPFLLRIDAALLDSLQHWAADELRSLNGQIEYLLVRALKEAGRCPKNRADQRPDDSLSQEGSNPGPTDGPGTSAP